jgi:2-C-methyl-D-erythritol 4-phosphate cytidylyltransferase
VIERVGAIVPAAGASTRMCGVDKLFAILGGRPLLSWCIETLENRDEVAEIVIAVAAERLGAVEQMSRARGWRKSRLVPGGGRRQDSVASALRMLGDVGWVLVHDGDRPFLTDTLIDESLSAARLTGVAVASLPLKDTVKAVDADDVVASTPARDTLRAVQTPQVFRADIMRHAYSDFEATVTDDAMLAERLGYAVRVCAGSYDNIKVTTPDDLLVAEAIARRWGGRT